jgi:tetratricopeptide (TPR) repeat protein
MNECELCGAKIEARQKSCPRCGFEFPKEVRSDTRDEKILEKYDGKPIETVRKDLKDKVSYLTSYFENLDVLKGEVQDMHAFIEEALGFLQVPMTMGFGDEMRFSDREEKLIQVSVSKLEEADASRGTPLASVRSYIRLANALNCLGISSRAMEMIEKALLKEPNNTDALYGKAMLLFYEKRYEDSKKYLAKLLEKTKADSKTVYLAEMIEQLSPT